MTSKGLYWIALGVFAVGMQDRKSTRLNSSHGYISYAVFCLKKKIDYRDPAHRAAYPPSTSRTRCARAPGTRCFSMYASAHSTACADPHTHTSFISDLSYRPS